MQQLSGARIINLAKKESLVQWFPSGIIEQLHFIPPSTSVWARNLFTGESHRLRLKKRTVFYCREVKLTEKIKMGNILPIR